jgi:hypothetical protein
VVFFVRVNADNAVIDEYPSSGLAQASLEEDRIVMVRDRQAPMKSHLALCRSNLMVDTTQERHEITQGMAQAIKLQFYTHSQRPICRRSRW